MSDEPIKEPVEKQVPLPESGTEIELRELREIEKLARKLVIRLVELENNPDFRSAFAVATIHGYLYKGNLWLEESIPLKEKLEQFHAMDKSGQVAACSPALT